MTSSDSALGATDPPTTKDTEYTQTVSKDAASIGQVSASQSGDSDSEASSGSDSEDSDSDSDDSDDSDPDSDDESSPDLISALLAAASGIPLNLPPPTDPSTPAVPSGLILDPAAANLAPTMKPNMSLASSMVSQSSSLSERLKSFIPQISESNRTLEQAGESERRKWMMETEEQGQGDGEVIEMVSSTSVTTVESNRPHPMDSLLI